VYTLAGGGTSSADGIPATSALLGNPTGIGMDAAGNFYFLESSKYVVRKLDVTTGLVHIVAGMYGLSGSTGDGGPAVAAKLSSAARGIWVVSSGDIYIADYDRIRRVDAFSGIITTVAGGGSSTTNGVPATSAYLMPNCIYVDAANNIYVGSGNKLKKIDGGTGLIYTIAGNGSTISSGDGGPATSAGIGEVRSVCMDNSNNLYFVEGGWPMVVRMINATTNIITRIAGGGYLDDEGIPATDMHIQDMRTCAVDGAGNLFIADWYRGLVRKVDVASGIVNTIAGAVSGSASSAEGIGALHASVQPYAVLAGTATGKIYYSDNNAKVRMFSYGPMTPVTGGSLGAYSSDSFYVTIYKQCNGPYFTVRTRSYHPGMTIRTFFGDGTSDTTVVSPSWSGVGGYILTGCVYPTSGTYSVMHVLYSYGTPVDTISYSYSQIFCSEMTVNFYNDENLNCMKDVTDNYLMKTTVTEIDSNGIAVDTLVATSGFSYMALGNPGDVYTFKVLSGPSALHATCPASGILYDTISATVTENPTRYVAMSCMSPALSDLEAASYIPVTGPNDQWGHIYIRNNGCAPTDASVTINFSPKYRYTGGARPSPVSFTATSITWNLASLNGTDAAPKDIYYVVWHNPASPYPTDGDTVNEHISVTTTGGGTDVNMTNNIVIRTDTVRTSCDPNAIEVSPTCFDNDTTFHFTVHFENIGSAPAENIYVMDTLSPWFDPSTFNIEMSTHPMFISKHKSNGYTIFKFDFPDINLADSSDHENRDGMLMYTIKNKPGMAIGDAALSRVGIYFDYNDVLMTNTVENRKGCPVPTRVATTSANRDISLFPNPTTGYLTIKTETNTFTSFAITNTIGQQVWQQEMRQEEERVNLAHLPAGVYYVTLKGGGVSEVRKFVKW
jgi:uncharacterized repeat protein (TIGR01451 family)